VGTHGNQVEKEHNVSSADRWSDRGGESYSGTSSSAYCSKHPKLWDEHLHYVQHAYNRAKHSSMQTSPFETCFGYFPKSPLDFIFGKDIAVDGKYDIDRAEKFIEQIQSIHQVVQE